MKGLISFVAVAAIGALLFCRITGRVGDHRSAKEKTVSALYLASKEKQDEVNDFLAKTGVPVRVYTVTRNADHIVYTYTVADERLAGNVASLSEADLRRACRMGCAKAFKLRGVDIDELLKYRAELKDIAITARYEDLHDKVLNSIDIPVLPFLAEVRTAGKTL